MNTDLAQLLHGFFTTYLPRQRGSSPHTLKSYRDTFKLLIVFLRRKHPGAQGFKVSDLTPNTLMGFLEHLEEHRHNCAFTRNQRLVAIQSFFRYVILFHPSFSRLAERVGKVPFKRTQRKAANSLTKQELEALLAQPAVHTPDGFRDLAILVFLYNTGARAQEVADVRLSWFDFPNRLVAITGKGNKQRTTPLWPSTVHLLLKYKDAYRRNPLPIARDRFFINQRGGAFTRFGVRTIVKKYLKSASRKCHSLTEKKLSTHSLRHTTAVHLLESKVEPNVIKSWLGHASISSTDRYLDTDLNYKRRILDEFGPSPYVKGITEPKPATAPDKLLDWLKDL